jgi:hypothetical protein
MPVPLPPVGAVKLEDEMLGVSAKQQAVNAARTEGSIASKQRQAG